jgi:hypothetical protein
MQHFLGIRGAEMTSLFLQPDALTAEQAGYYCRVPIKRSAHKSDSNRAMPAVQADYAI